MAHGKKPAIMFYPKDWIYDTQLQQATFATQGIWMNLFCYMHQAPKRGTLTGSLPGLARLVGALADEFRGALEEIDALGIATVTGLSQDSHGTIAISNRRMVREEESRIDARDRQRESRENKVLSQDCHKEVTKKSHECHSRAPAATANASSNVVVSGKGDARGKPEPAPDVKRVCDHWTTKIGACKTVTDAKPWIAKRLGVQKQTNPKYHVAENTADELCAAIDRYALEREGADPEFTYAMRNFFNASKGYAAHYLDPNYKPPKAKAQTFSQTLSPACDPGPLPN